MFYDNLYTLSTMRQLRFTLKIIRVKKRRLFMFDNSLYVINTFYNATTTLHPKINKGKENKVNI